VIKDKTQNSEGFWEITPETLLTNKASVRIIDVRRPEEFTGELGHVAGSELVTLETQFPEAIKEWDKNQTIVFVCRSGMRSGKATQYAQALGFKEVYNMEGGMILWNEKKLPTEGS
jgi:rhodanese-related sulfurtransferase